MFNPRTLNNPRYKEINNLPSMVEPCYNPSIAEIVQNPNCLVKHGIYDEGDDIPDNMDDNFSNEPLYEDIEKLRAPLTEVKEQSNKEQSEKNASDANEVKEPETLEPA